MANEITALEGNGFGSYQLLFLFPIAAPVQVAGTNVIPTPSSELPALANQILSGDEKSVLDDGTGAYRVINFVAEASLTNPQLTARAREIYAVQKIVFENWYADVYKYAGIRIDES